MKILSVNALSICCTLAAAYLIANDKGNWGWFVGLAFLTAHFFTTKKEDT